VRLWFGWFGCGIGLDVHYYDTCKGWPERHTQYMTVHTHRHTNTHTHTHTHTHTQDMTVYAPHRKYVHTRSCPVCVFVRDALASP